MPESQPTPPWGLAYDERDLDALLSGETGSTPAALQPVEGTLAALRAPATRRELADEGAARAAYRAFWPTSPPFGSHPSAPLPSAASGRHSAVSEHTLILASADGRPRPPSRHRHRRRAAASGRRRPALALTGAGAAALVVVAVVTGALTGSIAKLTSFGRQPASATASARATAHAPGSQGLLATGAAGDQASSQSPAPKPTSTVLAPPAPHPTPDPGALCRRYFEYLMHPAQGGRTGWVTERGQLAKLAGNPSKIDEYCLRALVSPLVGKDGWPSIEISPGAKGADRAGAGDNPNATASGPAGQSSAGISTRQGQSGDPGAAAGRP